MVRHHFILDTSAGPNFISEYFLSLLIHAQVRQGFVTKIADANNSPLTTTGIVSRVLRVGNCVVQLKFIVYEMIAPLAILSCGLCDQYVDSIRPCTREVELENVSTVPPAFLSLRGSSSRLVPVPAPLTNSTTLKERPKLRFARKVFLIPR